MQSLSKTANRQTVTRSRWTPSRRKRRREHPRLREIVRLLVASRALRPRLRRLGTLVAGAVNGHRVPKRERRRSRKTREKNLTVTLLHRSLRTQMARTVFQAHTGVAKDRPHAIDEMLMKPRPREKGGIPDGIVVAAAIAILGDHGADQSDQSVDADQEVDLSGEMTGGELAVPRVIAVTTTHHTGDRDHHAGGVLTEPIDVTHRDLLDGDGHDPTLVQDIVQGRGSEPDLALDPGGETAHTLFERGPRVRTRRESDPDPERAVLTGRQHTSTRRRKKPGSKMRSRSENVRRRHT